MAHRWEVVAAGRAGAAVPGDRQRTHASTTTVTRVAHWLRHGEDGYRLALDRLKAETSTA